MKGLKKFVGLCSLVLVILATSACSAIPKRELYTGYYMGIESTIVATHQGNKLLKVQSEMVIPNEMTEAAKSLAAMPKNQQGLVRQGQPDPQEMMSLMLDAFDGFSLKLFKGFEMNVEMTKDGAVIKSVADYKKMDNETINKLIKMAPKELTQNFNKENIDDFEKFEQELLSKGFKKK